MRLTTLYQNKWLLIRLPIAIASAYAELFSVHGVKLAIQTSAGSQQNLEMLRAHAEFESPGPPKIYFAIPPSTHHLRLT